MSIHAKPKRKKSKRCVDTLLALFSITSLVVLAICLHQSSQLIGALVLKTETEIETTASPALAERPLTFADRVADFPWQNLSTESDENGEIDTFNEAWADFFKLVFAGIIQEPFEPIDDTCTAPELPLPAPCASETSVFSGLQRTAPARIGHAIQLGFDIDVLEITLNELYDVVDKFFIAEWVSFHNGGPGGPKPLSWEAVKHQARFRKFQDKIVHLILDDVDTALASNIPEDLFRFERYQEYARWQKVSQWNELNGHFFKDTDIIGFGDADEIPSRLNVHLLKHCELRPEVKKVDIGIWFLRGFMDKAFRSDFPVFGYPFTLGDPTFWTFAEAKALKTSISVFPNRQRGTSRNFLLGGIHMTNQGYLPFQLAKRLSCTECKIKSDLPRRLEQASANHTKWAELEDELHGERIELPHPRIKAVSELDKQTREKVIYAPWFLKCNLGRYPTFLGLPDPRTANYS